jgi:preprotein translocase subunit SecY
LGELISEKGIGNGISLIIFSGIVANMPLVVGNIVQGSFYEVSKVVPFIVFTVITLIMLFVIIMFTEGNRNIPITYAGRSVRGEKAGLPIRINQAGMIPIIFAVSMITFPSIIAQFFQNAKSEWLQSISVYINTYLNSSNPSYLYMLIYFLLVVLFSYFYVSITFDPNKVSENIQKRGGFIPGIRPGKQTAQFLGKVSNHLNLFGGSFLGLVAVTPILFTKYSELSTSDLIISGSGLIIVVGVVLELIRQINAQLVMHDYEKLV